MIQLREIDQRWSGRGTVEARKRRRMQPMLLALEDRKLLSGSGTQAGTQSITGLQRLVALSGTTSFPTGNAGGVASTGGGGGSLAAAQGFDGLNAYQQRSANGGNQFNVEPPDEGLA